MPRPSSVARLRLATGQDAEEIAEIWHRGWIDAHVGHVPPELYPHRHLDAFRQRVPSVLALTWVATIGERIAGFIVVREDEIDQLHVAPADRRAGVGTALLQHGEQLIAERFGVAWLLVIAGNTKARHFYLRNGWLDRAPAIDLVQLPGGTVSVEARRFEKALNR